MILHKGKCMKEREIKTPDPAPKGGGRSKRLLTLLIFIAASAAVIVFTILCAVRFRTGFIHDHAAAVMSVSVGIELVYICATLFFMIRKSETVAKLLITGLVIAAVLLLALFIFQVTGFWDKIDSTEELRELISSTGVWAPLIFIVLQFMQVTVLPLPGTLTVGAGVLLFGPLKASLYSLIGIFFGSLFAFWIGKVLGYRAAAWLVGKDTLDKWLHKIKGKDKVVLSAMFILPIFPDDVLCFVAGLSTMSWKFFIVLQLIARSFSVFATSYSLNGSIIPYNTWWGILIWCLIGVAIIALFVLLFKKGDKIEKWFFGLFKKKGKRDGETSPKDAVPQCGEKPAEMPASECASEGNDKTDDDKKDG